VFPGQQKKVITMKYPVIICIIVAAFILCSGLASASLPGLNFPGKNPKIQDLLNSAQHYGSSISTSGQSDTTPSIVSLTYPYQPVSRPTTIIYPYPAPTYSYTPLPVPTIQPIPTQAPSSSSREWGSLQVYSSQEGLYLWIKSGFFATDIWQNYDMRWHGGGYIPVLYDNNILSGSYFLKATEGPNETDPVAWCGTAVVHPGEVTYVAVLPTFCPFGCGW
jgi:hypothetical protein